MAFWYAPSSPSEEGAAGLEDPRVEIGPAKDRAGSVPPRDRLAAERERAEERDRNDSGPPLPSRRRRQEEISELEDRAREIRVFPGEKPMPD